MNDIILQSLNELIKNIKEKKDNKEKIKSEENQEK